MLRALNLRKIFLLFGDIILLYISLLGTVFVAFYNNFQWPIFLGHLLPFSILYFFWLMVLYIFGLYDLNLIKSKFDFYPRLFGALLCALTFGTAFFYLIPFFELTPKTNLVANVLIFGLLILLWRKFFYLFFSSFFLERVAIVGRNPQSEDLAQKIEKRPYLGYKLVGILDENENLLLQIQEKKINTLILAEAASMDFRLIQNLYQCLPTQIDFLDLGTAYETICEKIPTSSINQTWFLETVKGEKKVFYDQTKRFLDVVLAGLFLILSFPLWLLIATVIKLEDRGPVFYSQERIGKDRKTFLLLKFRSMKVGAEKAGAVWAKERDPRTTKVGRFLRRTHLDELPQMLNILKGDLSVVGPRPERPEFVQHLEQEIPRYHLRHIIKPGFTGWAQIKFRYARSVMESKEKFQYDLYYLKNRSFILDISILLKTFQLFFKG